MAVSLEVRVPLLDHNVVEMVAGLDDQTRFSPLGRKQMLRDLALSDLDPSIFERPKSGFVMPIDQWCRRSLSNMMTEVFEDEDLCRSVGLEPRAVRAIWRAFCEGSPGIYWSRVWAIFSLMWWCRLHHVELAS
jgi:asparagine synthase (glutamine-hydrolysing)